MIGSHEMPITAKPPPGAVLTHGLGQRSSSPTSRKIVIASVIKAGTKMRRAAESWLPERVSDIGASFINGRKDLRLAMRAALSPKDARAL